MPCLAPSHHLQIEVQDGFADLKEVSALRTSTYGQGPAGSAVTVSMRVMSAGDGYKYLLKSVVAGDWNRDLSTPLTRYYAEAGSPPGFWLGSGVGSLGAGQLVPGDTVSEAQLQFLLGMGRDPITGAPLGGAYPVYKTTRERIAERLVMENRAGSGNESRGTDSPSYAVLPSNEMRECS